MQEAEVEDRLEREIWNSLYWAFGNRLGYLKVFYRQRRTVDDVRVEKQSCGTINWAGTWQYRNRVKFLVKLSFYMMGHPV